MRVIYAAEVTAENIDDIVAFALKHNLNLKDHLYDNYEMNTEDGVATMIVMHADSRTGPLYFDDMPKSEFDARYYRTNGFTRQFSPTGKFESIKPR